ncbi:DUF4430 domain-containing protein [Ruminococcus sp. OA3]|uniref:DUF4430 domain-containing protein n=1 Tax=Ruminococcus sp. OA3 TaxID=2914164 RepID=UPI001F0623CD|nr:DUF4430 domain-containing protein [Ruminococcus sp. OA3]MCH1981943.1 DUF4430 domain-containing protein [Ruminococcus sp. OA3]
MGQILEKINLWVRRHREVTAAAIGLLVVVLFSVSVFGTLSTQVSAAMENPVQGISDQSSLVQLSGTTEVVAEAPKGMALTAENDTDASDQPTAEDQQANESQANTGNNTSSANSLSSGGGQNEGGSQASGGDGGNSSDKDKDDKNLEDEGIKKGEFFTTSIQDNEVVNESNYSYTIMHKQEELEVLQVQNKVNKGKFTNYTGEFALAEGENQITVKATYRGTDGKTFSAVKTYTIYYEKNEENIEKARIETDLTNSQKTLKNEYSFSAIATLGGRQTELTINVERGNVTESITSTEDRHVVRELSEGINKVTLSAGKGSAKTTKGPYIIMYEPDPKAGTPTLWSEDLEAANNTKVSRADFPFSAFAEMGGTPIPFKVFWNDQELTDLGGGNFEVTLEIGNNTFYLQAEDSAGDPVTKGPYTVTYGPRKPEDDNGDGPVSDEDGPTIFSSLSDVAEVSNSTLNFWVYATDYRGNYIPESNYDVTRNGVPATLVYSNNDQISYSVQLDPGVNTFTVQAWDKDGFRRVATYQVTYNEPEETLGTVTVSIEGTTIGIGYLADSYPVEIKKDTPFSQLLVENFDEITGHLGFEAHYTGTLYSSFYLESISNPQDFVFPAIPADLEEHLLALNDPDSDEVVYNPAKYRTNQLGQFDFCKGSGWMYWVSTLGYPNVGMDQYYPQDGDVVRIRYTTYYGSDIGGSGAMGNGTNEGEGDGDWGEW